MQLCVSYQHITPLTFMVRPPGFTSLRYRSENAFHGTTLESATKIQRTGFEQPDGTEEDYRFGPGIYFWENSKLAAMRWVRRYYKGCREGGIIRADVKCFSLLDCLTTEHHDALEQTRKVLADERQIPVHQVKHTAVLSFLVNLQAIDGVRLIAETYPATMVDSDSKLVGPFDVILCIYNLQNILVKDMQAFLTE